MFFKDFRSVTSGQLLSSSFFVFSPSITFTFLYLFPGFIVLSIPPLEWLLFLTLLFSQQINIKINIKKIGEKKIIQNIIAIKFNPHLVISPHLKTRIQSIIIKSIIKNKIIPPFIINCVFQNHFGSSELLSDSSFFITKLH